MLETIPDPVKHQFDPTEALTHFQKANLANAVRLMADNQRCLDMANRRAKRFAQWESENVLGQKHEDAMAGDDDMKISIDSPEIHHHHSGNRFGMSPLAKVAVAGLLASGIGIPAAIGVSMLPQIISALRPGVVAAPTTQPPTGNLLRDYDLFVGEPEAPAPP